MPLSRLFTSLAKTRQRINSATAENWDDWRNRLLMADIGASVSSAIIEEARTAAAKNPAPAAQHITAIISQRLRRLEAMISLEGHQPGIIVTMGVNGSGKTTTIAKLSHHYIERGNTLLLAAGDTFRAAAREQLEKWAATLGGLTVISGEGDPAAVAYNATSAGIARKTDIVIIDTAGRLPTQTNLMAELGKIRRAIAKAHPGAPHELLLILDATSGQNTLSQLQAFKAAAGVTGLIITKLDGSAKGGFLLPLAATTPIPIRFIGTGETTTDLTYFDADEYAQALIGAP